MQTVMDSAQAKTPSDAGERLSCLMDGELDGAAGRAALAQLCSDDGARADWTLWHAVGDALRSSEVVALHSPRFAAGVAAALADEPAILAPRAVAAHPVVRRMVMPGVAAAAAALVLTVAALPMLRSAPAGGVEVARVGGASRVSVQAGSMVASVARSLPVSMIERPSRRESAQFEAYLAAHSQMSGSLGLPRTSLYLRQAGFGGQLDR